MLNPVGLLPLLTSQRKALSYASGMPSEEDTRAAKRARRQGRVFETSPDVPLLQQSSSTSFAANNLQTLRGETHSLATAYPSGRNDLRIDTENAAAHNQDARSDLPLSPFTPSFNDRFQKLLQETPTHGSVRPNDNVTSANDNEPANKSAQKEDASLKFDIFTAILGHPELLFMVAKNLPINTLLSLYAMSRDFHSIMDTRFATMILSQAVPKAPDSARIFQWKSYPGLCQPDPAKRNLHPYRPLAEQGKTRDVPTFRWLKMVIFREKVCHEIMVMMAEDGVRLPPQCEQSLKKLWYLMDTPDNVRRIGLMHNKRFFQDIDLFMLTMLSIKLDMRFNDPAEGLGTTGLKRMLLAQCSLSTLWRALKREVLKSQYDVLKMFVRWKWDPRSEDRGLSIFGIPPSEVGMMQYEWHGRGGLRTLLMQPVDLVMRECVKRSIDMRQFIKQFLTWGYTDAETLKDCTPKRWDRKLEGLKDDYEGDEDMGDDILDLGLRKQISKMVLRD